MPPPIFSSHYRGEHSLLYQRFPFPRASESTSLKPTSTSSLGFPAGGRKTTELPSPGSGRDSAHYSKFSPLRGEREDFESSGPARGGTSPNTDLDTDRDRERSPLGNSQRPHSSSSEQFEMRAKQMTSDCSSTDKGVPPVGQNSRRYPDVECERSGGRQSNDHVKTELASSPPGPGPETKTRTFSGDFSRDSLSRLSQSSSGSRGESFINQTAQGEFLLTLYL